MTRRKITDAIQLMIDGDDPGCGKEFNFSVCRLRHMAARLREERGERHGYDPCCYCPKFVTKKADTPKPENIQEEPKTMTTEPALTCIEPNCNNPVSGHSKTGRCHSCAARVNSKLAHEARRKKSKDVPKTIIKTGLYTCPNCGTDSPKNIPCPVCSRKIDKPAPKTGAKYQEMPGVGEYCPEPAANTIHARPPVHPLPVATFMDGSTIERPEISPNIYREAIRHYGDRNQIFKTAEEASELSAAIMRYMAPAWDGKNLTVAICEELADVEIMCQQMRLIFGNQPIDAAKKMKLERLKKRLEEY